MTALEDAVFEWRSWVGVDSPAELVQVGNYTDPDVTGAAADLTDGSDATGVTISSAGESHWDLTLDGAVFAGSVAFTIELRFDVVSRDMTEPGFECRITLGDAAGAVAYVQQDDVLLPDGLSTYTLTVDEAWVDAHPFNPPNPDDGLTYVAAEPDPDETYAGLVAGFGSDPVLAIDGTAGIPYVVELVGVSVVATSEPEWVVDEDRTDGLISYTVARDRPNANEKTAPLQASVTLAAALAGDCPAIGERFRLTLSDATATALELTEDDVPRFTGEVTDATHEPARGLYSVNAVGSLGRIRRRIVPVRSWPIERDPDRVERILNAAAPDAELLIGGYTADLLPPSTTSTAGQLLDAVVDSTQGQVVEHPDGVIAWQDAEWRRGATPVLELDAAQIESEIRWSQSVGDLLNDVTVQYGREGGIVEASDPHSIDQYETFAGSVSTILVDASAAHSLGSSMVGRRRSPVWQLSTLAVPLDDRVVSDELAAALLILRFSDRLTLTGLPAGSPYPEDGEVFLEGITESAVRRNGALVWRLILAVSDPRLSGVVVRWYDPDPDLDWTEVYPDLTWLDLATIEDPDELGVA